MPVKICGALLLSLLAVACSGSSGDTDGGSVDAGNTTDAGHTCTGVDAGCAVQADCFGPAGEDVDTLHVYTCGTSGLCQRQASFATGCVADVAEIQVQVDKAPSFAANVGSFEIRSLYPYRVDGTSIACADVLNSPDFPDGGSPLDVDTTLNVQHVVAARATCNTGGACTYLTNVSAVPGSAPVVLVQAYSGSPDITGTHATGIQLGVGCSTANITEQASPLQTIDITVNPD